MLYVWLTLDQKSHWDHAKAVIGIELRIDGMLFSKSKALP
jgi:hypothetical protein